MNKCKGLLIFNDDYQNINFENIMNYKDQIDKIIS